MTRPPLFAPFDGWLIEPDWAARVIASQRKCSIPDFPSMISSVSSIRTKLGAFARTRSE